MTKTKVAYIINPVSGTKKKDHVPGLIDQTIDKERFEYSIVHTERAGHATELAENFVKQGYHMVFSVGGDGTVNEIGRALIGTQTAMGIIPFGSGNGLARHMNIPMDAKAAIELINHSKIVPVDYGKANEFIFFCTCGVGFDAHIGHQFAIAPKRGFSTYVKTTLREYFNYKAKKYKIITPDGKIKKRAFLVTFANANQWGNNAYIAPHADIQDGLMDVCILKPFHLYSIPSIGLRLFRKSIENSSFLKTFKTQSLLVKRKKAGIFHFDGEPAETTKEIKIEIIPAGLKMVVEHKTNFRD